MDFIIDSDPTNQGQYQTVFVYLMLLYMLAIPSTLQPLLPK